MVLRRLRTWPRARWVVGPLIAAGTLVVFLSSSGANAAWWVLPVIGIGAALFGLHFATFVSAPAGADPTFCDLRAPVFAFFGLALATASPQGGAFAGMFVGPPGSIADLTRLGLGLASLAVLVWGARERLSIEQIADARARAGQEPAPCSTCRPLRRPTVSDGT